MVLVVEVLVAYLREFVDVKQRVVVAEKFVLIVQGLLLVAHLGVDAHQPLVAVGKEVSLTLVVGVLVLAHILALLGVDDVRQGVVFHQCCKRLVELSLPLVALVNLRVGINQIFLRQAITVDGSNSHIHPMRLLVVALLKSGYETIVEVVVEHQLAMLHTPQQLNLGV